MNKLTDTQKRLIVLGIGLLMVLFGLVQAIFKFEFFVKYKSIIDEVSFVLMMIAAMLIFNIKRKPKPDSEGEKEIPEQAKSEELKEKQV